MSIHIQSTKVTHAIEKEALTLPHSRSSVATGQYNNMSKNQMLGGHGSLLNTNKAQGGQPL